MKTLDILNLQKERNELRTTALKTQTELDWQLFRNIRNELRYKIKSEKRTFYKGTGVEKFKINLENNLQNS